MITRDQKTAMEELKKALSPIREDIQLDIGRGTVWYHNERKTQYVVVGFAYDNTNATEGWKVLYRKIEDIKFEVPLIRSIDEFKERFTRMG